MDPSACLEDGQMTDEDGYNKRPMMAVIGTNGFHGNHLCV